MVREARRVKCRRAIFRVALSLLAAAGTLFEVPFSNSFLSPLKALFDPTPSEGQLIDIKLSAESAPIVPAPAVPPTSPPAIGSLSTTAARIRTPSPSITSPLAGGSPSVAAAGAQTTPAPAAPFASGSPSTTAARAQNTPAGPLTIAKITNIKRSVPVVEVREVKEKDPNMEEGDPLCCSQQSSWCDWGDKPPFLIPKCELRHLDMMLTWLQTVAQVPFHIVAGTLLGAVRDGKHIPHDHDIDVAIRMDIWKLAEKNITKRIGPTGFQLMKNEGNPHPRLRYSKKNAVTLDIWLYNVTKSKVIYMRFNKRHYDIPTKIVMPLRKSCTFNGNQYWCPGNSKGWLRTKYGKNWMIPNNRSSNSTAKLLKWRKNEEVKKMRNDKMDEKTKIARAKAKKARTDEAAKKAKAGIAKKEAVYTSYSLVNAGQYCAGDWGVDRQRIETGAAIASVVGCADEVSSTATCGHLFYYIQMRKECRCVLQGRACQARIGTTLGQAIYTLQAHHHTVLETGLLQEKATLFKVDAQAEGRGVSQAAVFIFATIVISLVLAVAWMAIKQVFGIGCSEEAVDDSDFAAGVKRLLGLAPSEAATAGDDLIVKGPPLYGEPAGEGGDAIKSDVVKDAAKGAAETKARSPLEELRVKMQEADLTKEAALALSEKIAAKDSQ